MANDREDIDREIQVLETELKQLEAEYNMYFAGRLPRPPWETRSRVEGMTRRLDQRHIANYGQRFRFTTLQTRIARFIDLWDRALRAREEGRAGPFSMPRPAAAGPEPPSTPARGDRVRHVATFQDPAREQEKLRDLYKSLADARREAGQDAISYQKFAELVSKQVDTLRAQGKKDIAFRVTLKDGKVAFTARAVKSGGRGAGKAGGGDEE